MKKTSIILQIVITVALLTASFAFANTFKTDPLLKQAVKVVPKGAELVAEQGGEGSAFVAYTSGEVNYQFTLSGDMDPQIPNAKEFQYKGKKAFFFQPGTEETGGLMVILSPEKSLVIIYSAGYSTDAEVTQETMVKIVDKMDLDSI